MNADFEGHTPGPWTVGHEGQHDLHKDDIPINGKLGGLNAIAYEETDAKLIAAAPLLLAEVERLREMVEGYQVIWEYLDPKGYAWQEEEFVALLKEHGFETGDEEE